MKIPPFFPIPQETAKTQDYEVFKKFVSDEHLVHFVESSPAVHHPG